jgi:hypothetical protein
MNDDEVRTSSIDGIMCMLLGERPTPPRGEPPSGDIDSPRARASVTSRSGAGRVVGVGLRAAAEAEVEPGAAAPGDAASNETLRSISPSPHLLDDREFLRAPLAPPKALALLPRGESEPSSEGRPTLLDERGLARRAEGEAETPGRSGELGSGEIGSNFEAPSTFDELRCLLDAIGSYCLYDRRIILTIISKRVLSIIDD